MASQGVFEGLQPIYEEMKKSRKSSFSSHLVLVQQTGLQLALLRRGVDLRQVAAVLVVVYYLAVRNK